MNESPTNYINNTKAVILWMSKHSAKYEISECKQTFAEVAEKCNDTLEFKSVFSSYSRKFSAYEGSFKSEKLNIPCSSDGRLVRNYRSTID